MFEQSPSSSTRKLGLYAIVALALMSILLLHGDEKIVDDSSSSTLDVTEDGAASVGFLSRHRARPIKQVSILGERNSGTRWTYGHLKKCFNGTKIDIRRDLARYKHWFQHRNTTRYRHDTLVIAQFRNPYDWLEAMRHVPHHAPAHMFLEWNEFLSKEWNTERIGEDLNPSKALLEGKEKCQQEFKYNEVNSCSMEPLPKDAYDHTLHFSENQPFYELQQDGSGEPFKNIMEMRSAKIRNFLGVKDFPGIADVWVTQYEYLLKVGTKELLDSITEWTGVQHNCDPFPPQTRSKRPLTREYAAYVNKHLDWNTEGLVGYRQEPARRELRRGD